jgi:hypothetical protein
LVPLHNGKEAVREVGEPGDFIFFAGQNGRMTGEAPDTLKRPSPIVGVGAVIWNAQHQIVLIRRGDETFVPRGSTQIDAGDTLLLLAELRLPLPSHPDCRATTRAFSSRK